MQHLCPNCDMVLSDNVKFCTKCGAKQPYAANSPIASPEQLDESGSKQAILHANSKNLQNQAGEDPTQRRPCPYCQHTIPAAETICPFCGRKLDASSSSANRHGSGPEKKTNRAGLLIATFCIVLVMLACLTLLIILLSGGKESPSGKVPASADRSPTDNMESSDHEQREEADQDTPKKEDAWEETGRTLKSTDRIDPDCEHDGSIIHTYSDGSTETVTAAQDPTLRATGHDFSTAPIPAPNGQEHIYTCANDPSHTRTEPCLWDGGRETIAPTGFSTGVLTHSCTVCGSTREETIPALELPADTIVSISAGGWGSYALYADGTLVCSGRNQYGQCDVYSWYDITAISAGDSHIVGLRSDGTVIAAGWNDYGQCNVHNWTDIVAVSAGTYHTIGLKSDGTVVAVGRNENGQCNLSSWTDIVQVWAGEHHSVGLKSDGTMVAMGKNDHGQCDVFGWTDVISISAGVEHTLAVCSDGTVLAAGSNKYGQCDVYGWRNVIAICGGDYFTVALRSDGTVVATGSNEYGQCNTYSWTNVKAISCRFGQTLALLESGSVVAIGWNDNGQCNVSGW